MKTYREKAVDKLIKNKLKKVLTTESKHDIISELRLRKKTKQFIRYETLNLDK